MFGKIKKLFLNANNKVREMNYWEKRSEKNRKKVLTKSGKRDIMYKLA